MTKARDLANIISGGFTADDIPNLDAAKITSGTFADARIAASNVSQHATSFDDNKIVNDISTLGLRVHTQENLNASNSNSASFDVFQDSSAISNLTNCSRSSDEYVASVYQSVTEFVNDSNTILLQHFNGDYTDNSSNNMGGQFTGNNMSSSNFVTSEKKFGSHSLFLNGSNGRKINFKYDEGGSVYQVHRSFEGVIPNLERRYREAGSSWIREEFDRYRNNRQCEGCKGFRLNAENRRQFLLS